MKRSKKLPTTCFIFRLRRKSCHPYWRSCHYSFLPITSQFAVGVMWISPGIWQSRSRWSDSRLFSVVLIRMQVPQESASATFHRGVFDRAVDDQARAEGILKLAFITKPAGQEMTQH